VKGFKTLFNARKYAIYQATRNFLQTFSQKPGSASKSARSGDVNGVLGTPEDLFRKACFGEAARARRYARAVGKGSRSTRRWRNERQRRKKERDKRRVAALSAAARAASARPSSLPARTGRGTRVPS
jgi:hypothetical protein